MACDGTGDEGGGGFADEEDGDPEAFCLGEIEEVSFSCPFFSIRRCAQWQKGFGVSSC